MEKIGKENQQILLDLAAINQDRVDGYRAAIGLLNKGSDRKLIAQLEEHMQQAQQFKTELTSLAFHVETERPDQDEPRRLPWVIARESPTTSYTSRASLIDVCIKEEIECQEVYHLSLKNLEQLEESIIQLIERQLEAQRQTLNELQAVQDTNSDPINP